ncbi:MAG TPA: DUF1934 domain-containing protein [Candidatus Avanaerovorax faecigallinarum]|nr:DUF1934 domain-containing protein [Candidatus Avanaerovorax faecigallinarum]
MKDITIKITGNQFIGDEMEERMEFVTDGRMYERNGANYYIYEESEFSGFPGCMTSLKLKDGTLRMKRLGKNSGQSYGTELEFRKGGRFSSRYQTPFGSFDMEVLTNSLETSIDEDGCGLIKVDYHVSLEGMSEGRNALEIEISQ